MARPATTPPRHYPLLTPPDLLERYRVIQTAEAVANGARVHQAQAHEAHGQREQRQPGEQERTRSL